MIEELLPLLAQLMDPDSREDAAQSLASRLSCRELVIFVRDFELDCLLPAPGFPQTLRRAAHWQTFLEDCKRIGDCTTTLPSPSTNEEMPVAGMATQGGAMVLLGGEPDWEWRAAVKPALPLLFSALRGEQALQTAIAYREQAQKAESRAGVLTSSLDLARRDIELVERVAQTLSGELEQDKLVQALTDACTKMIGAQFGAFFHNKVTEQGESYTLYTLSGAPEEAFADFPMPRNTAVFGPTFRGEGPLRLDDVTVDARYGHNPPHFGTPKGHLPVRSYLAVPVVSATRQVLGGLFFGHAQTGMFSARHERLVTAVSKWASIALENARLYGEAQRVAYLKDQFLGLVSHELRTPLSTIYGNAHMIQRYGEALTSEDRTQALSDIVSESEKLKEIIENLLTLTRLEANVLEVEELDLAALVLESVATFKRRTPNREVQLIAQQALPKATGQKALFNLALENLLSNAAKYSAPGTRIEVNLDQGEAGWVQVAVRDHGVGIGADDLEKIFDPFFRSTLTEREVGGMGLGLTVCQRAIAAQGGSLTVQSSLGEGSEFRLALPPAPSE